MRYYKIPIIDNKLDMNYDFLREAIQTSDSMAYVAVPKTVKVRESWEETTAEEFEALRPDEIVIPKQTPIEVLTAKVVALETKFSALELGMAAIKADTDTIKNATTNTTE